MLLDRTAEDSSDSVDGRQTKSFRRIRVTVRFACVEWCWDDGWTGSLVRCSG